MRKQYIKPQSLIYTIRQQAMLKTSQSPYPDTKRFDHWEPLEAKKNKQPNPAEEIFDEEDEEETNPLWVTKDFNVWE